MRSPTRAMFVNEDKMRRHWWRRSRSVRRDGTSIRCGQFHLGTMPFHQHQIRISAWTQNYTESVKIQDHLGMAVRQAVIVAVAAARVFAPRFIAHAAASPGAEQQKPVVNTDVQDEDFDSYWTESPLYQRAQALMKESPLIDTHVDLPQIIRSLGEISH